VKIVEYELIRISEKEIKNSRFVK